MADKFQIIGMNLINAKKFKTQATKQITVLEEKIRSSVDHTSFRNTVKEIEERFNISQTEHQRKVHKECEELKQELKK